MANKKNDQSVLSHLDQPVKEEARLYAKTELSHDDVARLAEVRVELDQCWDLAPAPRPAGVRGRPGQSEGTSSEDCGELRTVISRRDGRKDVSQSENAPMSPESKFDATCLRSPG